MGEGDTVSVDQRVGDLEGWAKSADRRFDEIGRRMDKQDLNLQRIWERLDLHRDGQVKTQTLVEVGNRDVAELKASFNTFRASQEKEELAAKGRRPSWIQVIFAAGAMLIGAASLVVAIVAVSHGGVATH